MSVLNCRYFEIYVVSDPIFRPYFYSIFTI